VFTPQPKLGAAAAILAAVVMAGYVVLSKRFVGQSDSDHGILGAFLLTRQLLASAIMLGMTAARHGCHLPSPEHTSMVARLGFLNFVNAVGFAWGVKLTTAFVTSVMQLSIPILTLVYSMLSGVEAPSLPKGGALLFTLLGCVLVVVGGAGEQAAAPAAADAAHVRSPLTLVAGVAILVAQCASFVGLVVTQTRLLEHYAVDQVVGWSYAVGTGWSAIYCVADGSLFRLPELAPASGAGVTTVLYGALLGAVAYFELLGIATKHLSPTLVGISVALEPLCVSALGVCFFGYTLNRVEVGGYMCAAVGAFSLAGAYSCEERSRGARWRSAIRATFRQPRCPEGGAITETGSYQMVPLTSMSDWSDEDDARDARDGRGSR